MGFWEDICHFKVDPKISGDSGFLEIWGFLSQESGIFLKIG